MEDVIEFIESIDRSINKFITDNFDNMGFWIIIVVICIIVFSIGYSFLHRRK